jgi:hypothetical protein
VDVVCLGGTGVCEQHKTAGRTRHANDPAVRNTLIHRLAFVKQLITRLRADEAKIEQA